jgi:hypothetical protein
LKIIYTKGQREEAVASISTLKKILSRFVHHHVFYEMSARHRRSNQLYSVKSAFTVDKVEVNGNSELIISIFDAANTAHSIEIVNPHAMRVYDENPSKGFAVALYADEAGEFDVRFYLRDEGEDETSPRHTALERITLPQLFEYLQEIIPADIVEVGDTKK